jgi:hypothetical protein
VNATVAVFEAKNSIGIDYFSHIPDGKCVYKKCFKIKEILLFILNFLPVLETVSCTCKRLEKLSKVCKFGNTIVKIFVASIIVGN